MENLYTSFSKAKGHVRHPGKVAVHETHVVNINALARVTGGLGQLYEKIDDGTAAQGNKNDYGKHTNRSGHFIPEKGFSLNDRYIIQSHIQACGQSAVLVKAQDSFSSLMPVVIKVMHIKYFHVGQKEINTLGRLMRADPKHTSHTIRLLNTFVFDGHVCMVFPVLDSRPVTKVLAEKCLAEKQKLSFIRKVALRLLSALAFLRSENTIHADIKPANILLDTDGDVDSLTLVDFGNAIYHTYDEMSLYYTDFEVQTPSYRAPEVHSGLPFGVEVDMWSVGVVLLELFTGQAVFAGPDRVHMLKKIVSLLGPLKGDMLSEGKFSSESQIATESCANKSNSCAAKLMEAIPDLRDYDFASFLSSLLTLNPDQRATPWQALQHPFMSPEICISHFLYEPSTQFSVVKKADYLFKLDVILNKKGACSTTFDLLQSQTDSCAPVAPLVQIQEAPREAKDKGKTKTCARTGGYLDDYSSDERVNELNERKILLSSERRPTELKRKSFSPSISHPVKLAADPVLWQHISNTSRQDLVETETRGQRLIKLESGSVKENDQKEAFVKSLVSGEGNHSIEKNCEKREKWGQHGCFSTLGANRVKMQEDRDNLLDSSTATYTIIKKAQTLENPSNSLSNTSSGHILTPTVKGCEIIQSDEHKKQKCDTVKKSEHEKKKKLRRNVVRRFRSPKELSDCHLCSQRNTFEDCHMESCNRKRNFDDQRLMIGDRSRQENKPLTYGLNSQRTMATSETVSKEISNSGFSQEEMLLKNIESEHRSKLGGETRYGKMVSQRVCGSRLPNSETRNGALASDLQEEGWRKSERNSFDRAKSASFENARLSDHSAIQDEIKEKCCHQKDSFDNGKQFACITEYMGDDVERMSNVTNNVNYEVSVTHEKSNGDKMAEEISSESLSEDEEIIAVLNSTFTLNLPTVDISEEENACSRSEVNNALKCTERYLEKAERNMSLHSSIHSAGLSEKENTCNQKLGSETSCDKKDTLSHRQNVDFSQAMLSVTCQDLNKDYLGDNCRSKEAMEKIKEGCIKKENSPRKLKNLRSRKPSQSQLVAMDTKVQSKRRQRNGFGKVSNSRKVTNNSECEMRFSNKPFKTETKTISAKNKSRVISKTTEMDTAVTKVVQKRSSQRTCSLGVEYTENRMNYVREMYTDMCINVIKPVAKHNRRKKQLTMSQEAKPLPCKQTTKQSKSRSRTILKAQKRKCSQFDCKQIKKRCLELEQTDVEKKPVKLILASDEGTQASRDWKSEDSLRNGKKLTYVSADVEQKRKIPLQNQQTRRKSVKRALSFQTCETPEHSLGGKAGNFLEGTCQQSKTGAECLGSKGSKDGQKQHPRLLIFDASVGNETSSDPYKFIVTPGKKVEKNQPVLSKRSKAGARMNVGGKERVKGNILKDTRKIQDLVEETSHRLFMSPPQVQESSVVDSRNYVWDLQNDSFLEEPRKKNSTRVLQRVYHSTPCQGKVNSKLHNARSLSLVQRALDLNMNTDEDLNTKSSHTVFSTKDQRMDKALEKNDADMTNCNSCPLNEVLPSVCSLSNTAAKSIEVLQEDMGEKGSATLNALNVKNENENVPSVSDTHHRESSSERKESSLLVSIHSRKNERCTTETSHSDKTSRTKIIPKAETKILECAVVSSCSLEDDISLLL